MNKMSPTATTTTQKPFDTSLRMDYKQQSVDDRYSLPENFLEVEVRNPETHGIAKNMFTDYEIICRVRRRLIIKD